jgi:hypothetical protein
MPIKFGPETATYVQYNNGVIQNYSAPYYVTNMNIVNEYNDPVFLYSGSQPVGTYALLKNQTTKNLFPGDLAGGYAVSHSICYGTAQEGVATGKSYSQVWRYPAGSWRCMGYARQSASSDPVSLFVRVL